MAASGSRLLSSNRAGWAMAAPAVGLILLFIIVPFALAFGLSFTNQRLFSPNPTQWVGTANFKQLLGVGVLTLEPERDDSRRGQARQRRPAHLSAAARLYPQQPGLSAPAGDAGVVQLRARREPHLRAGERRRLHEGAEEHLPLRAGRGAAAGRPGAAAGADDQPEAPGDKLLPRRLLHAGRGLDRRRLAALALHLRRRQRAPEQRAVLGDLRRVQAGRLAGQPLDGAAGDHRHVDLAGGGLSHGDLARRAADHPADALRGGEHRGRDAAGRRSAT